MNLGERPLLGESREVHDGGYPAGCLLDGVEVAQVGLDELGARGRPGVREPLVE